MSDKMYHHPECDQAVDCHCELGHQEMSTKTILDISGDSKHIAVQTPLTTYDEMKSVPGSAYDRKNERWTLPLTMSSCVTMRGVFGSRLQVEQPLAQLTRSWAHTNAQIQSLRYSQDTSFPAAYLGEEPKLYDYQKVGAKFLTLAKYALLGDDMRVGKSPQAIRALRYLHSTGEQVLPALIVAPPNVKNVWKDHLQTFWPDVQVHVPKSGIAAAEKAAAAVKENPESILVLHYEVIPLLSNLIAWGGSGKLKACKDCNESSTLLPSKCEVHKKVLNSIDWKTVIADEVHRIGSPSALMTRAMWRVSQNATLRWGLTGTPPEDPDRLWTVMHFISPEEYPGKGKFQDRYVRTEINPYSGFPESLGWKEETRKEFDRFFQPRFLRRPRSVVHDVIEPQKFMLEPEMTPKQAKAYKDLKATMMAELENGLFWADSPGSKMARLRQLASAYGEIEEVEREDGTIKQNLILSEPSSKLDALEELIEELGEGQYVVFSEQSQLIELAATRYGDKAVKLVGGMSDNARKDSITRFQSGDIRIILCTTAAGGEGISLNAADTLIFLQRPWSRKDNEQSEQRIYKEGRPSFLFELRTPNTVEEKVSQTLAEKGVRFEELVKDADTVREWLK